MYTANGPIKSLILLLVLALAGCGSLPRAQPQSPPAPAFAALAELAPPERQLVAAVYDFPDLTGQYREAPSGDPNRSRAVSQGGAAVLGRALETAGDGRWFTVVERNRLPNVLTERQIIREQRQGAVDRQGNPLPSQPPLRYADVIFEGGIIGYDTNTLTGGVGARLLGIGAESRYREDRVTVYLRTVSSETGEVWNSVVASRRIYSMQVRGDAFRFVSADRILEAEVGFTRTEPGLIALRQAVEQAVAATIVEGLGRGLLPFVGWQEVRGIPPPPARLAEPVRWQLHFGKEEDYRAEHEAVFAAIAAYAQRYPQARLRIAGHADHSGPEGYNELLAEDRAWNAAIALLIHGVGQERVTYAGHGSTQPVASNATKAGRAQNRRVEITLLPAKAR